jgi:TolB-like protein/cytochrome c-type biogenesis protein CcmH/NrfG
VTDGPSLWQRLRERKLVQWALAYLAAAWVLIQVLGAVGDAFGWAQVIEQIAIVVLGIGLIGVLVLAWYHGEQGRQTVSGVELVLLIALCLIAGALVVGLTRRSSNAAAEQPPAVAAGSLAILPFENLSAADSDAYFAAGMHDELLTQLSKLSALRVVGRTSVLQYAQSAKSTREIGAELGVAAVLRASVQRAANRVRVRAQLIDADTDEHLWAETYDEPLDDVFAIQTSLATQIAAALNAKLSAREQAAVALAPTQNTDAYDAYLRGVDYRARPSRRIEDVLTAQQLFERAVQLDPEFALAYAALSDVHAWIYWDAHDRTVGRGAQARVAAERALQLQPGLAEARISLGLYHYRVRRDYERAIAEFEAVLRDAPHHPEALLSLAAVKRRLGKFAESAADMERAHVLDPLNGTMPYELGTTYTVLRDYPRATRAYDRALALAPDNANALARRALTFIAWTGTTDTLAAAIRHPAFSSTTNSLFLMMAARILRDTALARRTADAMPELISRQNEYLLRDVARAWALLMRGDSAGARAAFSRARAHFDSIPEKDERHYITLAHALAGLGMRAETRAAVQEARRVMPRDALFEATFTQTAAEAFAQARDADAAIAELRRLLTTPSFLSGHNLRVDPVWDPIRGDPRFQQLLVTTR